MFSFEGAKYEAGAALANLQAEIAYDPMNTETIIVYCTGAEPVAAHRIEAGACASKVPPVPIGMTGSVPEMSRLLDALEKKYREDHRQMEQVLSFGDYGKEGRQNVWFF